MNNYSFYRMFTSIRLRIKYSLILGCVGIAQSPMLLAKVVPPDQSMEVDYAGIK